MRDPDNPDAYMVVGDDTEEAVIEVLKRATGTKSRAATAEDFFAEALGLEPTE
jgi:hypothetical protein